MQRLPCHNTQLFLYDALELRGDCRWDWGLGIAGSLAFHPWRMVHRFSVKGYVLCVLFFFREETVLERWVLFFLIY